jgi:hypothetical protein
VIEEYEGTAVVPPGLAARRDDFGNIIIEPCAAGAILHEYEIDPFQLEVIRNSFDAIADDMAIT